MKLITGDNRQLSMEAVYTFTMPCCRKVIFVPGWGFKRLKYVLSTNTKGAGKKCADKVEAPKTDVKSPGSDCNMPILFERLARTRR